ncbi:MAG: beta-lactamase family protein [Saprospiraceae bacterium]|nr:beta-lactamase family protein [Saprospiraceae bacterium]
MRQPIQYLKKQALTLAASLFMVCSAQAQQVTYLQAGKGQKAIDLKDFSDGLGRIYRDSAVGWAYSLWKKGKLFREQSGGFKITPADCLNQAGVLFLPSTRLHVASMSKTITAIAIAKLVDQQKIKWEDRVKSFLPSYWKLHPAFEDLSILELVNMRSGLDAPLDALSSGTDSLRKLMEKGPNPEKRGKFNYQNTSYGLLRIIIGYATGYKELQPEADALVVGVITAKMYKNFVNEYLFKPAGIPLADCSITDLAPAFQYPFPYGNEPGELTGFGSPSGNGDLSEYAGGFGWYLSTTDAAKFINAIFVRKKILSEKTLTALFQLDFPFKIRKNAYGEYFGSGGDWGHPVKDKGWRGIHAYYYCFPEDVVVTVFVNSGEGSPTKRVVHAYEQAFK